MRVVAILSEKGGAGKSTLAIHLATAAHLAGQGVALLDLDPQGSAYDWAQRRTEPPEAQAITPVALTPWLDKLREAEADLVVIDTPRDANNISYTAAKAADLILIPLQPGGFDFLALRRTLDFCRLAQKRPFIVLNGIRPGSTRAQADLIEAVAGYDCDVAPAVLHFRTDFRVASTLAKTAQEFDPTSKAAEEIEALYLWLSRQLALATIPQHYEEARA
jgi:chromosome partitioning protein